MIVTPVYISVDGSIKDNNRKIDAELRETNINFCPTILNAIIALSNSAGTIIKVNFKTIFNWIWKSSLLPFFKNFMPPEVVEEKKKLPITFCKAQRYDFNDYWFTKPKSTFNAMDLLK